jgi:hypothetical protein
MTDIRIDKEELNAPMIDEVINLEKSLSRRSGEFIEDVRTPLYLNPVFYYAVAALLGAFLIWAVIEPYYNDKDAGLDIPFVSDFLLFGPVAGIIGLSIGLVYGISNRNGKKMLYCGLVGVGVGLGATLLTTFLADIFFGLSTTVAVAMAGGVRHVPKGEFPLRGLPFFVFMCGRGLAWSVVSMGAGLSLGVALKSKKLVLNGLAGGMVGGLLGGLLFDPVSRWLDAGQEATLSRAIGISAVGVLVGFFIGFFENISKDAWFLMLKGPLSGKQFSLFKSPMVIGSAPKCDIYLFKDASIEPRHASVTKSGTKYVLADEKSESGTYVNGRRVEKYILQPGDVITIGETILKYHERERK